MILYIGPKECEDQGEWVRLAFAGKTYAQELSDAMKMVREVFSRTKGQPLWLWGFSLGGISACCCAAESDIDVRRLIVAGAGMYPKKRAEYMFGLPIMNTLKQDISFDVVKKVKADSFIAFRGQKDEIFPKKACEKLYNSVKTERGRKIFYQLPGADHSIQIKRGDAFSDMLGFMDAPSPDEDFEVGNFYTSQSPASGFRKCIMCAIATPDGRISLFNNRLTVRGRGADPEQITLPQQLDGALKKYFGLDVSGVIAPSPAD